MKIIPFDIALREQIQSEENHYQGRYKVQTKSGNTIRIVCWDKKDFTFPIVALVEDSLPGSTETTLSFCQNGMYYPSRGISNKDLCLIDTWEPKFKVGDRVRMGDNTFAHTIVNVRDDGYVLSTGGFIEMSHQHLYSLVPAKTSTCFSVGDVIKCVDTGRLWLVCDGYNVLSDGHTTCTGGLYEAASKEEADKFFAELDKNGYRLARWGFIAPKPKFKIGDRIRYKNSNSVDRIADILECHYLGIQPDQSSRLIPFEDDDHLELVPEEPELTDFEQEVRDIVTSALTETLEDGSWSC